MRVFTDTVKKTIKLPDGREVERQANFKVNLPENPEEMASAVNGLAFLWVCHALRNQARILASNKLMGAAGDKSLKKSLRQFKESLRTMVDVLGFDKDESIETLLGKTQFEGVKVHFDALASGETTIDVDFTTDGVPVPRWFGIKEDGSIEPKWGEEDETEDEGEEPETV